YPELFVRVLQCNRVGNRCREGDLRRDPDQRSSARYDSGHCIPRRGDRTPRPANLSSTKLRRFLPCSTVTRSAIALAQDFSLVLCLRPSAFFPLVASMRTTSTIATMARRTL